MGWFLYFPFSPGSSIAELQLEPHKNSVRGNSELMHLERQQLPKIHGVSVERLFSSTAKTLPVCKNWFRTKVSLLSLVWSRVFSVSNVWAKKAFPSSLVVWWLHQGMNADHAPSILPPLPPCASPRPWVPWGRLLVQHLELAAVLGVREIQYETPKVWQKNCHFSFTHDILTFASATLLCTGSHLKASWNYRLNCPWPTNVLNWAVFDLYSSWAVCQGAVFVKADCAPPIPHGKQGQQQKLYRIKVLDKAMSVLVLQALCVSCPLLLLQAIFTKAWWGWQESLSYPGNENLYLASDPESSYSLILCKTELLAKPLSPPSPPIAFHPRENLRSELFSGLCPLVRAFCLIFYSIPWVVLHGGGLKFIFL